MTRVLFVLVVVLAAVSAAQGQAPSAGRTVRGQVLDSATGVPLRRARVLLSQGERQVESVFTDDEGFLVAAAPASSLTVVATKAGFTRSTETLAAAIGESTIRLVLSRGAAVTGRVLDSNGTPMSRAYVTGRQILPAPAGSAPPQERFFTQTDALGEYRLATLPAGRYVVTAAIIPPEFSSGGARATEDLLFGDGAKLATASVVSTMTLAAGEDVAGVDFTIPGESESCPRGPSVVPAPRAVAGAIQGRVTTAAGEPLSCAVVHVVTPELGVPQVYTDAQGRYRIEGLPAARLILQARKLGYIMLEHGQSRPSDAPVPIVLRAGERRQEVDFVLPRQAVLSGAVIDEHGEPVEGVMVLASRLRRVDGRSVVQMTSLPRASDDRGQYRLTGLEPGAYLVSAQMRGAVSPAGGGESPRGYASIFYPGTSDVSAAQQVTVDIGQDAHGIDLAFVRTPTATITGVALDTNGRPFNGSVQVTVSGRSGAVSFDTWSVPIAADGSFRVRDVPPGDYAVKVIGEVKDQPRFGMQYVTVVDADPAPVGLVVTAGATVHGRYFVEGAPANLAGSSISVVPADVDRSPGRLPLGLATTYELRDDGTFRVRSVTGPGRLQVPETPACDSCYLKSARVNGVDAVDTPVDFGLDEKEYHDVEVVISSAGAAIEGRITDGRTPVERAHPVLVFPVQPDLWYWSSRHVKVARSAPGGSFRVTGLPPGDYFVTAVDRLDPATPGPFGMDADILERLAASAQRVTVAERERQTVTLPLNRRP